MKMKKIILFISLFVTCSNYIYCSIGESVIETIEQFRGIFIDIPLYILRMVFSLEILDITNIPSGVLTSTEKVFINVGIGLLICFLLFNLLDYFLKFEGTIYEYIKDFIMIIFKFSIWGTFVVYSSDFLYLIYDLIQGLVLAFQEELIYEIQMDSLKSVIEGTLSMPIQILLGAYILGIYIVFAFCIITIIVGILKELIMILWLQISAPIYISLFYRNQYRHIAEDFVLNYIDCYLNMMKQILLLLFLVNFPDLITIFIKKTWNVTSVKYDALMPIVASFLGALVVYFAQNVFNKVKIGVKRYAERMKKIMENEKNKNKEHESDKVRKNILENISLLKTGNSLKEKELKVFIDINYKIIKKTIAQKYYEKKIKSPINRIKNNAEEIKNKIYKTKDTFEDLKEKMSQSGVGTASFFKASNSILREKINEIKMDRHLKKDIESGKIDIVSKKEILKDIIKGRINLFNVSVEDKKEELEKVEKKLEMETKELQYEIKKNKILEMKIKELENESVLNINLINTFKEKYVESFQIDKKNNTVLYEIKGSFLNKELSAKEQYDKSIPKEIRGQAKKLYVIQNRQKNVNDLLSDLKVQYEGSKKKINRQKNKVEKTTINYQARREEYREVIAFKGVLKDEENLIKRTTSLLDELSAGNRMSSLDSNNLL